MAGYKSTGMKHVSTLPLFGLLAALSAFLGLACTAEQDLGSTPKTPTGGEDAGTSSYATAMRTFATSAAYSGNLVRFAKAKRLTGPEAADWLCSDAANTAGLGGHWRAWISGSDADAVERVKEDGPWVSVDRTYVTFQNRSEIGSGANGLSRPVLLENGKPAEGAVSGFVDKWGKPTAATLDNTVYTGSNAGGRSSGATCEDWTSEGEFNPNGTFSYLNSSVGSSELGCAAPRSLLCLEQKAPVAAPKRGQMFITARSYSGDMHKTFGVPEGLEGADMHCNASAAEAGLKGNFAAWISGPKKAGGVQRASDRIAQSGFDGWADVTGAKVFFASKGSVLETPRWILNVDERGTAWGAYAADKLRVWTGTTPSGTPSAKTCSGWSNASSGDTDEVMGTADFVEREHPEEWSKGRGTTRCFDSAHLYCFEM